MGTHRADALVLEIDMCRGPQCLFQSVGAHQRCATVVLIHLTDFFGYFNPDICLIQFLPTKFLGKDGVHILRLQRLLGCRIQGWQRLIHHVCLNVVPVAGNLVFRQHVTFRFFFHCSYYLQISFTICKASHHFCQQVASLSNNCGNGKSWRENVREWIRHSDEME